jgi:heme/copper-type cytochrome/quinol oxidase subunit 4
MVVVVGGRSPTPVWAFLIVIAVILVVVGFLLFLFFGRGSSGLVIVAIPGFPVESIFIGLATGLLLLVAKRGPKRKSV